MEKITVEDMFKAMPLNRVFLNSLPHLIPHSRAHYQE